MALLEKELAENVNLFSSSEMAPYILKCGLAKISTYRGG